MSETPAHYTVDPGARQVVVTGGAHRLGAQLCHAFAQAGWRVLVHYHHSGAAAEQLCEVLQRSYGVPAFAVQADLASAADRAALIQHISLEHGAVHCWMNNASLFEPDEGVNFDDATALAHWQVNLLAPMALARDFAATWWSGAPAGADSDAVGCVIHVLDQKVFNLNPDYFSYTVSKLALERAVALQAQALAPRVRVCGVAPGLMYLSGDQTPENFAIASQANLMRRPIDPAQVAQTCLFLAQTPAINGVTLAVDNGQHLVASPRDIMFMVDDALRHPSAARSTP